MTARPDSLRVVSWNVHAWRGADGLEHPQRVGEVLRELKPDIAGLQEVVNRHDDTAGGRQLERLTEAGRLTAVNGPTIIHPFSDYGNALLTRLPVREVRHIDLSFPEREPRAALDVDLDAGGIDVRVIVTHLGLRPAERRFQVRRLIQAVEEHRSDILLLLGDINEWFIYGRPARWLHRHFGHPGAPATFPAFFPVFGLDRIFASPPSTLLHIQCIRSSLARQASDHLPLLAQIGLESPAQLRAKDTWSGEPLDGASAPLTHAPIGPLMKADAIGVGGC